MHATPQKIVNRPSTTAHSSSPVATSDGRGLQSPYTARFAGIIAQRASVSSDGKLMFRTSEGRLIELPPDMSIAQAVELETEAKAAQKRLGKGPQPKPVPDVKKLFKKDGKKEGLKLPSQSKRHLASSSRSLFRGAGAAALLTSVGKGKAAQFLAARGAPVLLQGIGKLRKLRENEQTHDDASEKRLQSERAVVIPPSDGQSKSNAGQVHAVGDRPPPAIDAKAGKRKLQESLAANTPQSIEDVDNFKRDMKAQHMGSDVMQVVQQDKTAVTSTFGEMERTPSPQPPEHQPQALPPEEVAPATAALSLGQGAIAPLPKEFTDVSKFTNDADNKLKEEGITQEQLDMVDSGDLAEANKEKKGLEKRAQTEPAAAREFARQEALKVDQNLKQEETSDRNALRAKRKAGLGATAKRQKSAQTALEKKREEVAAKINGIFQRAQTSVKKKLADLERQSMKRFDEGNAKASQAFEQNVNAELDAYKDDRYSGMFGWARKAKDWVLGMDDLPAVKAIFERNRSEFVDTIGKLVDDITADNKRVIQECKDELQRARKEIQEYVDSLGPNLKAIGNEAAKEMNSNLNDMDQFIANKEQELQTKLKDKQTAAIKAIDEKIEKMKEAMSGALAKLGNLLLWAAKKFFTWALQKFGYSLEEIEGIINKGKAVLKAIFTEPIAFVKNLIRAATTGFANFAKNFLKHLKDALFDWLGGSLEGITSPASWDLRGIASVAFQILGLTWANIRAKLVTAFGSEAPVKAMEAGFDVVVTLVKDGPIAAWEKVKEMADDIKMAFVDGVKEFIQVKIVQKAIETILSLLVPGAGIVRAIIGIYDTIVFFIQKAKQIAQMVGNFLSSVGEIAAGNIGAAADALEKGLATALKLVINFLAKFLRLDGVTAKIRIAISKLRSKVNDILDRIVEWIVSKAKKLFTRVVQAGVPQDPKERLRLGLQAAAVAVNRFAGKKVGAALLRPLLSAIKLRYQMQSLDVVLRGSRWAVHGMVNPEGEVPTDAQAETGAAGEAGNVRELVANALLAALAGEPTLGDIRTAIASVSKQFSSEVVKRIELGEADENGNYPILVQASAFSPLLLMKLIPDRVIVGLVATLRFSQAQQLRTLRTFLPSTLQAPGAPAGQVIGRSDAAGVTLIHPIDPTTSAQQGSTVQPVMSHEIQAVTYNTAHKSLSRSAGSDNDSHAEFQFITWFNSDVPKSSIPFLQRVELTITHSPCSLCSTLGSKDLVTFIRSVSSAFQMKAPKEPLPVFVIRYRKPYNKGPTATTTADIAALRDAGYLVVGPAIKLTAKAREEIKAGNFTATIYGQRSSRKLG